MLGILYRRQKHARDSTIQLLNHSVSPEDLQKCPWGVHGRCCPAVLIPGEDVILGKDLAELHLLQEVC